MFWGENISFCYYGKLEGGGGDLWEKYLGRVSIASRGPMFWSKYISLQLKMFVSSLVILTQSSLSSSGLPEVGHTMKCVQLVRKNVCSYTFCFLYINFTYEDWGSVRFLYTQFNILCRKTWNICEVHLRKLVI